MVTIALNREKLLSALLIALLLWLCTLACARAAGGANEADEAVRYEAYYRHAWQLLRDNSLHEDKLAMLCGWEHKFDGQLDSLAAAESAVNDMLASIGDHFTYFRDSQTTAESAKEHNQTGVVSRVNLPEHTAWIKVQSFHSEFAAAELKEALLDSDSAEAYILDLRDNPGGSIYQAFSAAAMFLDSGNFALLKGRWDGEQYLEDLSIRQTKLHYEVNGFDWDEPRCPNLTGTKPLVVLVNKKTSSAAEMLAGALRDNRRCLIVGERTLGKGVVQRVFGMPGGSSLKIVFAKTYSPAGYNIHNIGMAPDYYASGCDEQLRDARHYVRRIGRMKNMTRLSSSAVP